jgi:hypothetical protein
MLRELPSLCSPLGRHFRYLRIAVQAKECTLCSRKFTRCSCPVRLHLSLSWCYFFAVVGNPLVCTKQFLSPALVLDFSFEDKHCSSS